MHDHDGKDDSWMMWIMMLCCAVPLLLVILFGLGGRALGTPTWVLLGGVAVMVLAHFFVMNRSPKHSNKERVTDGENKDDHTGHMGCH